MSASTFATQTMAMLLDAYRELNSKRLFWITLAISLVSVLIFAMAGISDDGITFLGWQFDTRPITAQLVPPAKFYLYLFANVAVRVWLTWLATILALISTSSIFPDFLASGTIDLTLARPISRLRLFATKYVFGLLFVALQVAVFALACFAVVGIRGGTWEPRIFLAVPIVVLFFSYLFGFCVLFGMLTRSAIASLLLTLLVWLGLWGLDMADQTFLQFRESAAVSAARTNRGRPTEATASETDWARALRIVETAKAPLPKTTETIQLLDRWTLTPDDKLLVRGRPPDAAGDPAVPFGTRDVDVPKRVEAEVRLRTVGWIIGTSLLCEAAVVGVAAWIFCRRDF